MLQHTTECALAVTFLQLRKGTSESRSPEVRSHGLPCKVALLGAIGALVVYCREGGGGFGGGGGGVRSGVFCDSPVCADQVLMVQAYEPLQRSLLPVLHQLESLDEGSEQAKARDWSSLQMLVRRTKNQLVLD